ncbi:MAG: UDP-4-amino-4,6-dideoxy-N-acetyl-beta-L-altrosamine N-acetyltransferase [Candidatus Heimdallarchaeota archaeon]
MSTSKLPAELRKNLHIDDLVLINFINMNEKEARMVLRWRNNPRIRKWMYNSHKISWDEHLEFIKSLKRQNYKFYFLVKWEKEYLGVVYLTRVDWKNKNAYLGIYVAPEKVGMGKLLGKALLKLVFEFLHLHTLKLEVIKNNFKAITLYKKLGFKKEGELREFVIRNGRWKNVIVMGMTENEYGGRSCKKK